MTISRMQQPRQMYGLGSLVKSITKGVKSAVKGVADVAKSPVGLAALGLGTAGLFGAGPLSGLASTKLGTTLAGLKATPLFEGAKKFLGGEKTFGKTLAMFGLGTLGGSALQALEASGATEQDIRDIDSLRSYLRQGYRQLNPEATDDEIEAFVEQNTVEYRADGGRIGFRGGDAARSDAASGRNAGRASPSGGVERPGGGGGGGNQNTTPKISEVVKNISNLSRVPAFEKISNLETKYGLGSSGLPSRARHMAAMNVLSNAIGAPISKISPALGTFAGDTGAFLAGLINEIPALGRGLTKENLSEIGEDLADNFRGTFLTPNTMTTEQIYSNVYGRPGVRQGGRMQYAFGDVVDQASGIMGLPQRTNQAGVKELDLRKSGGFIPPVGIKEKADDIPAMLSNNEFVFTADAVRGMGDGNVNKGAQRMYDMMKALENKVV